MYYLSSNKLDYLRGNIFMNTVYILLAEGFEEIEALTVVDILRRGDIKIKSVAIGNDLMVMGAHGIPVKADMLFDKEEILKGEMLILPGGGRGTQNLKDSGLVIDIIKEYINMDKYIAAICAAPSVLGVNGLLEGKTAVCYPGFEVQLENAVIGSSPVEIDGKIITSKGPGTAMEFALVLLGILSGIATSETVKAGLLY